MKEILEVLEPFVRLKMTKAAKRRCRRFLSNEKQLILYIISEYNCYEARKGANRFIVLYNPHSSGFEGGMKLITNPSELMFEEKYIEEISLEVKSWLTEFFIQEQYIEEENKYECYDRNTR